MTFGNYRAAFLCIGLVAFVQGCDVDSEDLGAAPSDAGTQGVRVRDFREDDAGDSEDSGAAGRSGSPAHAHAGVGGTAGNASGGHHTSGGHAGAPPTKTGAAASFNVALTAEEEMPRCAAGSAMAAALGSVYISDDGESFSVVLSYSDLSGDATLAHIHFGAIGAAGPVVLDLGPSLSSPIRRTFKAPDYTAPANAPADFAALVQAIRAGQTYFNIHTAACGSGELRGQIDRSEPEAGDAELAGLRFNAKLTAAQEVPLCGQAAPGALGMGTLTVGSDNQSIAMRLNFSALSGAPVAGHVHLGAPGVAGPVLLNMGNLPSSTQVFFPSDYTAPEGGPEDFAALIEAIRAGQTYFNIHTDACGSGEVRGQILDKEQAWSDEPSEFQTRLTTEQEIPVCAQAAASAVGIGALVINPDETQLAVSLSYDGLSGAATMAHIHFGAADATGPVVLNFGTELKSPIHRVIDKADYVAPDAGPADFASLIAAIRSGKTYFNMHTAACAAGEIRGQIEP